MKVTELVRYFVSLVASVSSMGWFVLGRSLGFGKRKRLTAHRSREQAEATEREEDAMKSRTEQNDVFSRMRKASEEAAERVRASGGQVTFEEACSVSARVMTPENLRELGSEETARRCLAALAEVGWTTTWLCDEARERMHARLRIARNDDTPD